MSAGLANRRILVTGAASGMGQEIAALFVQQGASLALLDRNGLGLAEVVDQLGAAGYACDVSDRAQTNRFIGESGHLEAGSEVGARASGQELQATAKMNNRQLIVALRNQQVQRRPHLPVGRLLNERRVSTIAFETELRLCQRFRV